MTAISKNDGEKTHEKIVEQSTPVTLDENADESVDDDVCVLDDQPQMITLEGDAFT